MGIDELVGRLEERAEAEAASLLEEARREADGIRRRADSRLEERREERVARRERELREAAAARIAEVRREEERRVLAAREELLDRVFRAAARRLNGDQGMEAFRDEVEASLGRAVDYLDDGPVTVICRPGLAAAAREALEGSDRPGEVVEEADADVGLEVRAADGYPRVLDCYVDRLRRRRPVLAIRMMATLEDG